MQIRDHVPLKDFTTFRMGGTARYFVEVKNIAELKEVFDSVKKSGLPVIVLGGGSNVIIKEGAEIQALVIHIAISGFEILVENDAYALVKIGAGLNWDEAVAASVARGLSGIEAMSAIPGTAGATPIQNVGAYGQEIKDTLVSVECYEIETGKIKSFAKKDCNFSYRDSIFKHEAKDKYIITEITLELSKKAPRVPEYPGVKKYFEDKKITKPTLAQIREAIIDIRKEKLPDPKEIASVGSFFKNPIVSSEKYLTIKKDFPNVVAFPLPDGSYKLGAGSLIDILGLKGKTFGNLALYAKNTLVIVNKGNTTYKELHTLVAFIQNEVRKAFGIELEQEPVEI